MNIIVPFFLITILFSVSCGKSGEHRETDENIILNFSLSETFDANIDFINFSLSDKEKMEEAIEIIKLVIGTEEFRNRVINHTYNGQKTFVDNNGKTNEEIYQMILDGAETLRPVKNNTMDGEVELYFENNNIIGYTYPNSHRIWVNAKYFHTYTPAGVAHNFFHEWMHKLGFVHSSAWSPSRDYSVPYALGYLMGEIGKDFL